VITGLCGLVASRAPQPNPDLLSVCLAAHVGFLVADVFVCSLLGTGGAALLLDRSVRLLLCACPPWLLSRLFVYDLLVPFASLSWGLQAFGWGGSLAFHANRVALVLVFLYTRPINALMILDRKRRLGGHPWQELLQSAPLFCAAILAITVLLPVLPGNPNTQPKNHNHPKKARQKARK
jgi:hypothetical protein